MKQEGLGRRVFHEGFFLNTGVVKVGRLVGIHCIRNAPSGLRIVWQRTTHIQGNGLAKGCGFTGFRVSWLLRRPSDNIEAGFGNARILWCNTRVKKRHFLSFVCCLGLYSHGRGC